MNKKQVQVLFSKIGFFFKITLQIQLCDICLCGNCDHHFFFSYFLLDSLQHTGIPLPHGLRKDSVNEKVETKMENAESVKDRHHHWVHCHHTVRVNNHQEHGDGHIQREGEAEDSIGPNTDQFYPGHSFLSTADLSPESFKIKSEM